jgi:hypothetical protein
VQADLTQPAAPRTSRDGRALPDSASMQVLVAESAIDVAAAYALGCQDLANLLDRGRLAAIQR